MEFRDDTMQVFKSKLEARERISAICNKEHHKNVTDINIRYNIVKRENCCFICLKKNTLFTII